MYKDYLLACSPFGAVSGRNHKEAWAGCIFSISISVRSAFSAPRLKSMSDTVLDYLRLSERHHHVHLVVLDQDFAVADAEDFGCCFADDPNAFDGCLLAPPERALATGSEPIPRTLDAEALTVADAEALTVADRELDASEA
jgi:hypothetical protein